MNVLIITRSFVREVSELVKYVACHAEQPLTFHLILPHDARLEERLPASVSVRHVYLSKKTRLACFGPSLFIDFLRFQPDIVQVFEEYSGLLAFQSFLLSSFFLRKSSKIVYSAENIVGNVRPAFQISTKYVMRRAELAFVCSNSVKETLRQEGALGPIEVFPLGVDTAKFYKFSDEILKQRLKLDGKFVVGYIGRLLRMKGVFMLVEMLTKLPENVHAVFIGSGSEEQQLQEAAVNAGVESRVHLLGNIPYSQLPNYINCVDVGIVPSLTTPRWKEQFGRCIIEFMSCEVPVIGSDSGSIPEVLSSGGRIFAEDNLQELLAHVTLFMNSSKLRYEYGAEGRDIVLQHYSLERMGEIFLKMYRRIGVK